MNQPSRVLRACVLTSSLLLSTAFVLYRGGALDGVIDTSPRSALAAAIPDSTDVEYDTVGWEPRFPGSKSMVPLIEPRGARRVDTVATTDTAVRREVFMGGSKSMAPLVPDPTDSAGRAKP